ncbi:MAG: cation acetate symporter [Betaproteobacteria bacterium TMED41]|nr:MAG: cation acetate symporter [Betaproteobacteria bacterium TMED41]
MNSFFEKNSNQKEFTSKLKKVYSFYTLGFVVFCTLLAIAEQFGLSQSAIGYIFLFATIGLYAGIGFMSRTNDPDNYYVAGRRVPAMFNGMATGADWMSAASFIGLAGGLYFDGFRGLAFVMGWTGGYVLVALLLAPYLRRFGQYTIPDFLGARYGNNFPRLIGIGIAVLCSFTYVVAQIKGVGLITTRLSGVSFEVGVFLGLAGILVCSFLGGMRAVTWTQVSQYIVLIIAYLIPVIWLSVQQTNFPIPQLVYGQQLQKVTDLENKINSDPAEIQVRNIVADAKLKLKNVSESYADELSKQKEKNSAHLEDEATYAEHLKILSSGNSKPPIPHAEPFPGETEDDKWAAKKNFFALLFCLALGTASLPHILMRYYTTPSVSEARTSVTWSLLFIILLYFTAPALAVLVKFVVYNDIVGITYSAIPAWVEKWSAVDTNLLSINDINSDNIIQLAEITIHKDIIVLATPEIAGLPFVVTGMVAAGGLAAALSTSDGLLLSMANSLSHDLYYKMIDPSASVSRRVTISKTVLLFVAVGAALVAQQNPADILFLVSAAFSFAAAGFFPALVLGIFWQRTTGIGASLGMLAGILTTFYYMSITQVWLRSLFYGVPKETPVDDKWFEIDAICAGVFGVPIGFAVIVVVSLITKPPKIEVQELVHKIRYPELKP